MTTETVVATGSEGHHGNGLSTGVIGINPSSEPQLERPLHANRHLRVVCIGAGASGIMLAYKLKRHFTDFTLHIFEKNSDVGGTWFENRCE